MTLYQQACIFLTLPLPLSLPPSSGSPNRRWVEYRNEDLLGDTSTVPMTW